MLTLVVERRVDFSTERDPDSRPPTNSLQGFANNVHHLYKWTKTPEALVSHSTLKK